MKNPVAALLSTIFVLVISAFAESKPFSVALKGGIGLSTLWGNDAADSSGMISAYRSGFYGGICGAYQFSENFAVQLEGLYAMKGKSAVGDYADKSKGIFYKLDYCEIPVTLRYSIPISPISDFMLFAGPNVSYRLSATKDSTILWEPSGIKKSDTLMDLKTQTNPFDFGITVGGGMAIDAGPGEILFDVRYTLGLVSIDKVSDAQKSNGTKQLDLKNSNIGFMLGYRYKF